MRRGSDSAGPARGRNYFRRLQRRCLERDNRCGSPPLSGERGGQAGLGHRPWLTTRGPQASVPASPLRPRPRPKRSRTLSPQHGLRNNLVHHSARPSPVDCRLNVLFQFRTARQPQRSGSPLGCRHPPPRLTLSCFRYVSINDGTLTDTRGQCKPAVIGRVRAGAVPRSTPSGNAPAARRPLRLVAEAARPGRADR